MKRIGKKTQILIGVLVLAGIATWWTLRWHKERLDQTEFDMELPEEYAQLEPFFVKPAAPRSGEWLAHNPERGQTFQDYRRSGFCKPAPPKNTIYILPLGEFTPDQEEILQRTAKFLPLYYNLPARCLDARPLPQIPNSARRDRDSRYGEQLSSQYLLNEVLKSTMPEDAFILLGFIAKDIWPGGKGNMVFGQALTSEHIAICSLARICPAGKYVENRSLILLRALKVSTHECGHLFSMLHCTWYLCNMAGSNSHAETDRHPLALCPHCYAKIGLATGANPIVQLEKLGDYCRQHGLTEDERLYHKMLAKVRSKLDKTSPNRE